MASNPVSCSHDVCSTLLAAAHLVARARGGVEALAEVPLARVRLAQGLHQRLFLVCELRLRACTEPTQALGGPSGGGSSEAKSYKELEVPY